MAINFNVTKKPRSKVILVVPYFIFFIICYTYRVYRFHDFRLRALTQHCSIDANKYKDISDIKLNFKNSN